jgi:hypothetical protein
VASPGEPDAPARHNFVTTATATRRYAHAIPMVLSASLNAAAHSQVHTVSASTSFLPEPVFLAVIAALVLWVVVYLLYKLVMTERKDFGMPVKRRLLCRGLRVDHDQSAEVPFWWNDLQVQRAVRNHWKQTLRAPLAATSESRAQV